MQALTGPFYKEEGSNDGPQEDNKVGGPRSRAPALPLPIFGGYDFNLYAYDFARWLRLTEISEVSDATQMDWLVTAVSNKGGMRAMVDVLARKETSFPNFVHRLASIFPTSCNETQVRTDLSLLKGLSLTPSHQELESLLVNFEMLLAELPENSISESEKCLILASKVPEAIWDKLRRSAVLRPWTENYEVPQSVP